MRANRTSWDGTRLSAYIVLGSDSLQCQYRNRTHSSGQKIPSPGGEYLCLEINGKTAYAAKCSNSSALAKVIDFILEIGNFEQKRFIIKGLLQSTQLKNIWLPL